MFDDPTIRAQQARSRDTAERLLQAAETLLAEEGLSGLSVSKVVKRAKSSVGSFYARFQDKDGILQALHARHMRQILEALEALGPEAFEPMSLADASALCMHTLVDHYQHHRNLMAAFISRSTVDPEAWRATIDNHLKLITRLSEILGRTQGPFAHPEPERALALGLHAVFAFLGNMVGYRQTLDLELPFSDEDLPHQLNQLLLHYVQGTP